MGALLLELLVPVVVRGGELFLSYFFLLRDTGCHLVDRATKLGDGGGKAREGGWGVMDKEGSKRGAFPAGSRPERG